MSTKNRVFVSQQTLKRSPATGEMFQFPSLKAAEKFGEVKFLLDFNEAMDLSETDLVWALRRRLVGFNDKDYVLPLGNPEVMALAISLAAEENNGRVKVLRFNRDRNEYEIRSHDFNAQPRNGEIFA